MLKEAIEKLKGLAYLDELEEQDDEVTKDRYLRSLRRERRIQMEEEEKKHLIKAVKEYKKDRDRKHFWGMKNAAIEKKVGYFNGKKKKAAQILKERNHFIQKGRVKMKNRRGNSRLLSAHYKF
jgi:hypothetical protein